MKITLAIVVALVLCSAFAFRMRTEAEHESRYTRSQSRLQQAQFYYSNVVPNDATYNGACKPMAHEPETCGSFALDQEWQHTISCGWYNGYNAEAQANKGVTDSTSIAANLSQLNCVGAALTFKNGTPLCQISIYLDSVAFFYSGSFAAGMSNSQIYDASDDAVRIFSPTYDYWRDCV